MELTAYTLGDWLAVFIVFNHTPLWIQNYQVSGCFQPLPWFHGEPMKELMML